MAPRVGVAPLRREQIVRATIHCLAHGGYAGLTMKRVAARGPAEPGHPPLLLRGQAGHPRRRRPACDRRPRPPGGRGGPRRPRGARAASARWCAPAWRCRRPRPRGLDGVHRVLGRDPARSDAGRLERARVRAQRRLIAAHARQGVAGRARSGARARGRRRLPCWAARRPVPPAHVRPPGHFAGRAPSSCARTCCWAYLRHNGGEPAMTERVEQIRHARVLAGQGRRGCPRPEVRARVAAALAPMEALLAPVAAAGAADAAAARGVVCSRGRRPPAADPRAQRGRAARPSRRAAPRRSAHPGGAPVRRSARPAVGDAARRPPAQHAEVLRVLEAPGTRPPTRARRWWR